MSRFAAMGLSTNQAISFGIVYGSVDNLHGHAFYNEL